MGIHTISAVTPYSDWQALAREVIHRVSGDDVTAYLGFFPEIKIVESPRVNAFALPSNKLVLSSGLLSLVEDRSELAFVIAHELSHMILHHSAAPAGRFDEQVGNELAADRRALELMASGGYDTHAALALLERVLQRSQANGLAAEALYPSIGARVAQLHRALNNGPNRGSTQRALSSSKIVL